MINFLNISFISISLKLIFLAYIISIYLFFKKTKFSIIKKCSFFLGFHLFLFVNLLIYIHINISNSIQDIKTGTFCKLPNITLIKNIDGNIIGRIGVENREYEILKNIPDDILKTIICVEDENFFNNYGVSFQHSFFNFLKALFTNKKITGASTITQQLSRNLFLSKKLSIIRKLKEVYLSFYLSFYFTKDQILEMYVNYIYFGDNCYGIKSSSKYFFHKDLKDLNKEEIAFLVALIKGPSYYLKNLDLAMERKDYVLNRMLKTNIINHDEYISSKITPINLKNKRNIYNNEIYSYVIEEVKEWLKENNLDAADGYVIEVTINENLHKTATDIFNKTLEEAEKKIPWKGPIANGNKSLKDFHYLKNKNQIVYLDKNGNIWNNDINGKISDIHLNTYKHIISKIENTAIVLVEKNNNEWFLKNPPKLNGGGVIIDIHTGKILSTIGGKGFNYSFINSSTNVLKSPGSVAKILTTTAAFENGKLPSHELLDTPIYVNNNGDIFFINENQVEEYLKNEEIKGIKVIKNYDKKYMGLINLKKAITSSRNIPLILLIKEIGINKVKEIAVKMGIVSEKTPFYLSSTLGTIYVSLRDMAKGIASIGNGGYQLKKLHIINKVTDLNNNIIYEIPNNLLEERTKILKDNTIQYSNEIYHSVGKYGVRNKLNNINKKICCKTGTAQGNKEASFVVWDKNYLIYFMIYNTDIDENLINNNFLYELWGSDLPLIISKNILEYLSDLLEDALYLNNIEKDKKD
jgi:penicillin-binding protein 1A